MKSNDHFSEHKLIIYFYSCSNACLEPWISLYWWHPECPSTCFI